MIPTQGPRSETLSHHLAGTRRDGQSHWTRRPVEPGPAPETTWPASPDAVSPARRDVARRAREAGASEAVLADIELAVSEACTNSVLHAYVAPGVHGQTFTVSTAVADGRFCVWVGDEGRGVAALSPSPGMGLGLKMMAEVSQEVLIGVRGDGATQVRLQFPLDQAG